MPQLRYRDRRAFAIENDHLRLTVLEEGGHIAEILDKATGVNPLWTPPWVSMEPSAYDRHRHPGYGSDAESRLLAGIMGHNLCMDVFGPVSEEEAAAGLTVHGEASVASYDIAGGPADLTMRADLPAAQLRLERSIRLSGPVARIEEAVENLSAADRPIGWTQHVTLGPPFLERGRTAFRASATRSKVYDADVPDGYLQPGAEFTWPHAPRRDGGAEDLQLFTAAAVSAGYTTHLMDPAREHAWFTAWAPATNVAFGYLWRTGDFPWMGIWEENHSRTTPPWNGETLTRGMEFGASPVPETRRAMISRGQLFGVPGFRWIPARSTVRVTYWAVIESRPQSPAALELADGGVRFV